MQLEEILPAMGYSDAQLRELEAVINACDCDVVLAGTPMDLTTVCVKGCWVALGWLFGPSSTF